MFLQIDKLSAFFGDRQVLHDIDLNVMQGEIVCLLGANASGKTTTLRSILGLVPHCRGAVVFGGQEISRLPTEKIVEHGISIVPENRRLFPRLTVSENLRLVFRDSHASLRFRDSLQSVAELFPLLRESARLQQLAGTLSGGEQQQVAMARALLAEPRLLLLDEPSMGMALELVKENFRIIRRIAEKGIAVLMVEQNVRMALSVAARGYVLQEGRIITSGTSCDLLASPVVQHAYLGEFIE